MSTTTSATALKPFRALSSSLSVMKQRAGALWGGGLLITFIDWLALGAVFPFVLFLGAGGLPPEPGLTLLRVFVVLGLLAKITSARLTPGVQLAFQDAAQAEANTEEGVFGHRGRFLPLLKWRLITLVLGQLVASVFYAVWMPTIVMEAFPSFEFPTWWWRLPMTPDFVMYQPLYFFGSWALVLLMASFIWTAFMFVEQAVIFEGRGVLGAVSRSWSLGRGNRFRLLYFFVAHRLFVCLGYIITSFCCAAIGGLPTGAWTRFSRSGAFLLLTAEDETNTASEVAG